MSIERSTLSDFMGPSRRDIILEEGGIYGRNSQTAEIDDQPEQECLHCGRSVPSSVARVLGDNDGCVPACDGCWTSPGGSDYEGVARAVRQYRAGTGLRKVDGGETDE